MMTTTTTSTNTIWFVIFSLLLLSSYCLTNVLAYHHHHHHSHHPLPGQAARRRKAISTTITQQPFLFSSSTKIYSTTTIVDHHHHHPVETIPLSHTVPATTTTTTTTTTTSTISTDTVGSSVVKTVRKGSAPEFVLDDDSTVVTPSQLGLVTGHFLLFLTNLLLAGSQLHFHDIKDDLLSILMFISSLILGDFGTGIFHWSVDNYGSKETPIFGSVCHAFQGHHQNPWTITYRPFANNVYKIAIATLPILTFLLVLPIEPHFRLFLTFFINWWLLSQEIHKYSHMIKPPVAIKWLQDQGWLLSRKEHGLHHSSPFEGHYCIITGQCNAFFDETKFFRYLEKIVYQLTGNKPMTWKHDERLEEEAMGSKTNSS